MAIGIRIKINMNKIRTDLLYPGKKGQYLNATVFYEETPDKYGQNGGIMQDIPKGGEKVFIGNVKKFWEGKQQQKGSYNQRPGSRENSDYVNGDEIPF